jgi:hypothetical protein
LYYIHMYWLIKYVYTINMLEFLIDSIFVIFGGRVFSTDSRYTYVYKLKSQNLNYVVRISKFDNCILHHRGLIVQESGRGCWIVNYGVNRLLLKMNFCTDKNISVLWLIVSSLDPTNRSSVDKGIGRLRANIFVFKLLYYIHMYWLIKYVYTINMLEFLIDSIFVINAAVEMQNNLPFCD